MTTDRSFRRRVRGRTAGALLLTWLLVASGAEAQAPPEYRMPPEAIANLLDAPPTPGIRVAPDGRAVALLERPALESIRDVARPELRLAGLRIDPRTLGPSRAFSYSRIVLKTVPDGTEREVSGLPADPRIRDLAWSPDGARIAFSVTANDAVELWVAEAGSGWARRLLDRPLSDVYGDAFHWLPDGSGLVVKVVPGDRGAPPPRRTFRPAP